MHDITLILLAAGSSSRFKLPVKKQWLYQGNKPLWLATADRFQDNFNFKDIIVVSSDTEIKYMKQFSNYIHVTGGSSRSQSINNALQIVKTPFVLISDIARCCLDTEMINRVISQKGQADCIVPTLNAVDTLYMNDQPIDREMVRIVQTPQLSRMDILKKALQTTDKNFTDESSAIKSLGGEIIFVEGSPKAHKLTTTQDLKKLPCIIPPSSDRLTGFGVDIHQFEDNKEMKLCGITIDVNFGFKAHSDGDVAIHALIDALMGAAGMGDIGELFPDADPKYAGVDSSVLLKEVAESIRAFGFEIVNTDMTILAETPKLTNYKTEMKANIANYLNIPKSRVNIKATTAEKMGFVGKKEGVTVYTIATLKYFDWREWV